MLRRTTSWPYNSGACRGNSVIVASGSFDYVAQHYTPGNMVVAAAGAVDHNQLVDLANSAYGDMKYVPQLIRPAPARYTGGDVPD